MSNSAVDPELFRQFERDAHDRIADSYHAFFVPITRHAADPLLDVAAVRPGTRILDVATGSGIVAARAVERGAVATGVDLSPRMVALAAHLHPDCDFRAADAETLPFDSASFDAVVCCFGIGHFPRPEAAVAECVRMLAPLGKIAFSWWDAPVRNRLHGVILEAVQESDARPPAELPVGPPMFRYSDDREFEGLLRSGGLQQVAISRFSFNYRLPSADALWDGAMSSTARTSVLVREQLPAVQLRIRSAFDRLVGVYAVPGGIDLPVAFNIASGQKF